MTLDAALEPLYIPNDHTWLPAHDARITCSACELTITYDVEHGVSDVAIAAVRRPCPGRKQ